MMKKFIFAVSILLAQTCNAFHQSCIKDDGLVGDQRGSKVSDFEALDAATKGMRLSQMDIVLDKKDNVLGLQLKL